MRRISLRKFTGKSFPSIKPAHRLHTAQHRAEYEAVVVVLWNGTHSHLTRESLPEEQRQNPEQLFGRWMAFACIGDSHQQSLTELLSLDDDATRRTRCAGAQLVLVLLLLADNSE